MENENQNNNLQLGFIIRPLNAIQIGWNVAKTLFVMYWFLFIATWAIKQFGIDSTRYAIEVIKNFNLVPFYKVVNAVFTCICIGIVVLLAFVNIVKQLWRIIILINGDIVHIDNKIQNISFDTSVKDCMRMFNIEADLLTCIGRKEVRLLVKLPKQQDEGKAEEQ